MWKLIMTILGIRRRLPGGQPASPVVVGKPPTRRALRAAHTGREMTPGARQARLRSGAF